MVEKWESEDHGVRVMSGAQWAIQNILKTRRGWLAGKGQECLLSRYNLDHQSSC